MELAFRPVWSRRLAIVGVSAVIVTVAVGLPVGRSNALSLPNFFQQGPATAFQVNPRHTGGQRIPLAGPIEELWSDSVVASTYPLVVNNTVYAVSGSDLYALSAQTGNAVWGPIDVGGDAIGITADGEDIFVQVAGLMLAYSLTTGREMWSATIPGQYLFTSYPTAGDGYVYTGGAGSGGTVYAFNESTGALAWTAEVENGDDSSPTVTPSGVYVDYACNQTYDFAPTTGSQLWHYSGPCEGGGGSNTSVFLDRLYAPGFPYSSGLVFNASTGNVVSSLDSETLIPSFTCTGIEVINESGTLRGENPSTNQVRWSFAGDGELGSALAVSAGANIYVASAGGHLYTLNASTGYATATTDLIAGTAAPLSVGDGVLVVPTKSGLEVFS